MRAKERERNVEGRQADFTRVAARLSSLNGVAMTTVYKRVRRQQSVWYVDVNLCVRALLLK